MYQNYILRLTRQTRFLSLIPGVFKKRLKTEVTSPYMTVDVGGT